jgi:TPR repeat protein
MAQRLAGLRLSAFNVVDRTAEAAGLPRWDESNDRIWSICRQWDFAQASDENCSDFELNEAELNAAEKLFEIDQKAGIARYLGLAEQGSPYCMSKIGHLYWNGEGGHVDRPLAEEWFRRSAHSGSQRDLLDYNDWLRRRKDYVGAAAAFEKAAEADWGPALFWLAWHRLKISNTNQTSREVRPLLERAAGKGSPAARRMLAREMSRGRYGLFMIPQGLVREWEFSQWAFSELGFAN